MTQERLNHSFMLNAHKPRVAELDLKHIAKLCISANDRRCAYFGKMKPLFLSHEPVVFCLMNLLSHVTSFFVS